MTIRLKAPEYKPGGPDGKGWNRLSLNAHMGTPADQCALQPRSWGHLAESRPSSLLARWGNYGRCIRPAGSCGDCPVFAAKPTTLAAFTDQVLARILPREGIDEVHLMNKPEDGWASSSRRWSWEELARLVGWKVGRRAVDEHSDGFWLVKENPISIDGRPSPCPHEYLNPQHCRKCRIEVAP